MVDLYFEKEVYEINGAAMDVYNCLGNGFLESVYQEALAIEFGKRNIPFKEQNPISISYKDHVLKHVFIPDFIAYDRIIVELKSIRTLGPNEEAQLFNYLKASRMPVGVLLNFGAPRKLEYRRKVLFEAL